MLSRPAEDSDHMPPEVEEPWEAEKLAGEGLKEHSHVETYRRVQHEDIYKRVMEHLRYKRRVLFLVSQNHLKSC